MRRGQLSSAFGFRLLSQPRFQLVAVATVLALFLVARASMLLYYSTRIEWGHDFAAYWRAGQLVMAGESVYAPFQTAGTYSPQQAGLYLYPPFLAVVMAPVTALIDDYRTANWLWAAIGAAILFVSVTRLAGLQGIRDRHAVLLAAAAFAFAPVVGELIIGNVHLMIVGLLAAAWMLIQQGGRRGELGAGVLIGVATLIKVFPGLLIVWLLLRRRFRAAAAAVVAIGILAAATVPVTGLGPWLDYPTVLLNLGPPVDPWDVLAPTVWLSDWMPSLVAKIVVTVVGLATVAWVAQSRPEPISFALTVAVSVLIAPAVYQHYLAVLVLPMLLAIRHAPPIWWVGVAYLLMSGGEQEALGGWVWIINRLLPTAGALLVVVGLIWFSRSTTRQRGAALNP